MNNAPFIVADALQQALGFHQAGQLRDAERLYRAILQTQPKHPEALHLLGVIAAQVGRFDAAIDLIRKAISQNQQNPAFHCSLGDAAQETGDGDLAHRAYAAALKLAPHHPMALFGLGNLLRRQGDVDGAVAQYEQALKIMPLFPEALSNLGNILKERGDLMGARARYEQALAIRPDFADAPYNLGGVLEELGAYEEAVVRYEQALRYRPDFADAHYNLGNVLSKLGDKDGACRCYEQTLALVPDFPEAAHNLGLILLEQGKLEEALALVDRQPRTMPDLLAVRADALMKLGRLAEAEAVLEEAIRAEPPGNPRYFRGLSRLRKFSDGDPHVSVMQAMAENMTGFTAEEQMALHFALGKAYEDVKKPELGFPHLLAGNALVRQTVAYDEPSLLESFAAIRAMFTPAFLQRRRGHGDPSSCPVFVLGMPRSGSTLVEQILGSHPAVYAAGELNDLDILSRSARGPDGDALSFPEMLKYLSDDGVRQMGRDYLDAVQAWAPHAQRIVDKMPSNFRLLGLIHLILPNAKIIHTRRNPVDTCLSCFSTQFAGDFQPFTNDLAELGRYWRAYDSLMTHWHAVLPEGSILDVQYEDVVADLEGQARRIVAHVGLAWNDACLSFHATDRPVLTASAAQVRRPLYKTSVGRWHPYRHLLQPLLEVLEGVDGGRP